MVDNKRKKKKKGGATKKYDLLPRTESSMPNQQDRYRPPTAEPFTSNVQAGTTTSIRQERYYRSPMESIGPSPTSPFFSTVSRPASSMSIQQDSRYCGSPMAMGSPLVFLPNSQVVATPPPYANIAQQQQQQQQPIQSFVDNPQATYPEAQFEMVLGGHSPYNGVDVNQYVVPPRYEPEQQIQIPHTSPQVGTHSWYTPQVSTTPSSNLRGTGHQMQPHIAFQQSQRQMSSPSNNDEDNHREIATKKEGRSWAVNPGRPYYINPAKRNGPPGANLFIFHIPDDYTNMHLLHLFERFGCVVSVRISVEASTGRGQGFGFVSYDNPESAKVAIQHLHGFQIGDKRLSVQYKTINKRPDSKPEQLYNDVCPQEELQVDKSDLQAHHTSSVPTQETTRSPTQPRHGSSDLGEVSPEVTLPTVAADSTVSLSTTPTTPPPTKLIELSRSESKTPSSIGSKLSSIASLLEEPSMFQKEIQKQVYNVVINEVHPSKVWSITDKLIELGDAELRDLLDNPAEMNIKIQQQALQLAKANALNNIVNKNDHSLSNLKDIEEALPNDI